MSVIECNLRAHAGTLRLAQPSIQIDVLLKHSRIGDIGVASLARPQFMVEKIKSAQRPPRLLLRDGFNTQRSVPLTQYGLFGGLGLDNFKELARRGIDPCNPSALEGYSRDGKSEYDAAVVSGMNERALHVIRFKTEMVSSTIALRQHGSNWGVVAEGCDKFDLGQV